MAVCRQFSRSAVVTRRPRPERLLQEAMSRTRSPGTHPRAVRAEIDLVEASRRVPLAGDFLVRVSYGVQ